MSVGELLGWIGALLYVARLVPQPWHTRRSGLDAGVSTQALCNNLASDVGWVTYGLLAGLPPIWIGTSVAVVLDLATIALVRHRLRAREVAVGAAWLATLVGAWFVGGPVAMGLALGASVAVSHAPQVAAAVRGADLSGLHPATWWLALADAALWGGYGLADGDAGLVAYGLVLSAVGAVVRVRIAQTRGLGPPTLSPAG